MRTKGAVLIEFDLDLLAERGSRFSLIMIEEALKKSLDVKQPRSGIVRDIVVNYHSITTFDPELGGVVVYQP